MYKLFLLIPSLSFRLPVMEITDNYHALHALDEFKMKLPDGGARTALPEEHPLTQNFLAFSGNALVSFFSFFNALLYFNNLGQRVDSKG